jgi:putative membrane protein
MKKMILKLCISILAIIIAVWVLPGVTIYGLGHSIDSISLTGLKYATFLAILLSLLNVTVKPILINALVVLLADWMMDSVKINGFFWALIFSIFITVVNWFMIKIFGIDEKESKKTKLLDQYGKEIN